SARECLGERREYDAGGRISLGQAGCSMQQHNGLAGSGTAAEPEGSVVVLLGVAALLRVEEHPPCSEVATLDDAPELLFVLDVSELHARRRMLERLGKLFVFAVHVYDVVSMVE